MATEEEKNNQQELNRLLKEENELLKQRLESQSESLDLSSSLVDSVKEVLGINTKRTTADSTLLKVNKQINTQILNQKTGLGSISEINKRISKNQDIINKGKVTEQSLEKLLKGEKLDQVNIAKEQSNLVNQIQSELDQELQLLEEGKLENLDNLRYLQESLKFQDNILDTQLDSLSPAQQQLLFTSLNVKELEKQNEKRKEELKLAEELEEKLGVAGKLNKLIGTIPGLGGAASKALKEVTEELERAAENSEELPSKAKVAGMQFKALGKNLVKDLVDPTTLAVAGIAALGKALLDVDKQSGEFAKDMGISYQQSLALRKEMNQVALANEDILITSKELINAQSELNEFFGQSVAFSGEIASEFASIQKRTNLSTKALGMFTRTAMESGVATEDVLVNIEKTRLEQNNLNRLSLSAKQIQEGIAEASNAFQLSVGKSVTELTKAFFASKQLGVSFQQLESLADNLLDFESSIQSELQAELLTGKQLNLEKARQAALDNDLATLATEIKNQIGSAAEFGEMNRIQQEAIAGSIGMQRDELANVLMEQENINTLQGVFGSGVKSLSDAQKEYNKLKSEGRLTEEQVNTLAEKGLADQMASASTAERFQAVLLRIQEIFIGIAEPVLAITDSILTSVGSAENLANILMGIGALYVGIKATLAIMSIMDKKRLITATTESALASQQLAATIATNSAKTAGNVATSAGLAAEGTKAGLMASQAAAATTTNAMTTFGLGTVIAVGAVVAALAALGTYLYMKDGIIGPGGEMVVSSPKGSIQLDKDDSIIAGTNLLGNTTTTNNATTNTTTTDNTALIAKMDKLIAVNERILAKSSVIEMNGNEVGQGIQQSERAIQ